MNHSHEPDFYLKGWVNDIDYPTSDQQKGKVNPPYEKKVELDDNNIVNLVDPNTVDLKNVDIRSCFVNRESRRNYTDEPVSLDELSFILWSTQGIKQTFEEKVVKRVTPSAGSRHPFETYISVSNVDGVDSGIYRYIASKHILVLDKKVENISEKITKGCIGQKFCGDAPVFIMWSVVPYRTAWRYGDLFSIKAINLDGGHLCQNLYLACEALGLGTCAIGAYDQDYMDNLFGFDGKKELSFYMAPIGRVKKP